MARQSSADELQRLAAALLKPAALIELGVIAACLLLAWGVARALRSTVGGARIGSPLFGDRIVDGALFPALALLLVLAARWLIDDRVPAAVFAIAVPVLMSLAVIRLTVRVLHHSFPGSGVMRVVERSVSWLAWAAVVLWVTGLLPLLLQEFDSVRWKMGGTTVTLRMAIEGTISAVLVLTAALWLSSLLEARLLTGATDNIGIRKMAANLLRALLLFVGLIFALQAAGIDLTALGVLGGALGVGIGFGLQKLAANYISGFVILAERSMRIGDLVKVDGFEGRITDISTRYTVIRAGNGREAIVPNEMMITQRVENSSLADPRVGLSTVVQVAYGSDLDTLLPLLAAAVAAVPKVLADPAPNVQLTAFGVDGLELTVGFWTDEPHAQGSVRSDANLALLRALDAAGVEIAYPQRVVRQMTVVPMTPVALEVRGHPHPDPLPRAGEGTSKAAPAAALTATPPAPAVASGASASPLADPSV